MTGIASTSEGLPSGALALCTVSTYDHLHMVVNLVRTVRETWAVQPRVYVGLTDGLDRSRPGFDKDVEFVDAAALVPGLGWLAAKYDATDLCCAIKPYVVRHAFGLGYGQVIYADSDLHFFADPAGFRERAARHPVVVIPHTLAPFPEQDAWRRPSLGDLYGAGMMNAGLCSFRREAGVLQFLDTWARLVTGPGAFDQDLGPQHEQNSFNWVMAFVDGVSVYRDPLVNVAYWNVHERPIRWSKLDGGSDAEWTLDGKPIHCFHFSGFRGEGDRISYHDQRNPTSLDINLHGLQKFYAERLEGSGKSHYASAAYPFAHIGDVQIDTPMRIAFRKMERYQEAPSLEMGRWREGVEELIGRMLQSPSPSSVLPPPMEYLRQRRPDLQFLEGDHELYPRRFLQWFSFHAFEEYAFARLVERLLPYAWDRGMVDRLASEIERTFPDIPADEARRALTGDRFELVKKIEARAGGSELWRLVRGDFCRFPVLQPALCLRLIYEARTDLQAAFPDPMGRDFGGYRAWLRKSLVAEYEVPEQVLRVANGLEPSRSLARVLAFVRLNAHLTERFRAEGLWVSLVRSLVPLIPEEVGFSADDLLVLDWWIQGDKKKRPEAEKTTEGKFTRFLQRKPQQNAEEPGLGERVAPLMFVEEDAAKVPAERASARDELGVNVYGYFASPIGLGTASRGLSRALALAGRKTREVVLTNTTMAADFDLDQLVPRPDPGFARNIVVSYPHIQCDVFDQFPKSFFSGRENIGYMAWEQRDFHPEWVRRMDRYDRLLALSSFAAQAIERGTGRPVSPLPCVVDVDLEAARRFKRSEFQVPEGVFAIGLVMDATSSLERKNPIGALRAVSRAFAGRSDVFIVVKVTNGGRGKFRAQVEEAMAVLRASKLPFRLETKTLSDAEVHGLIGSLDLYISLHRAEGFGYTLAEAMTLGVPAVASRYSGNLDFMNDGNSWLVDCGEMVVKRPDGPFRPGTVWGDPSIEDAAAKCLAVYENRSEAARRAERAKADVEALLSPKAVARRLAEILG